MQIACPDCSGTRFVDGSGFGDVVVCEECEGQGQVVRGTPDFLDTNEHPDYLEPFCYARIARYLAWACIAAVFLVCMGITAGALARQWGWV